MTFDIGISFRATAGYVTDPANCTYSLDETYPVTRGGATFGWVDAAGGNGRNRSTSVDARLAGIGFRSGANAQKQRFRLDLPASGAVDVYCSIGDNTGANSGYLEIFDNTSSLGVLVTKHTSIVANSYYDASDTLLTASNWPASNVKSTLTFATTTLIAAVTPGDSLGTNYTITHLRVAQPEVGGTTYEQAIAGSITPAGALSKQTAKSYSGSSAPTGALAKQTAKSYSGSITPSSILTSAILFTASIAGSITASGALNKMTLKALSGASAISGAITKLTGKGLSASLTVSGEINKLTTKAFAGAITVAGALTESYQVLKSLAGSITVTGAVAGLYIAFVAGTLKMLALMGVG